MTNQYNLMIIDNLILIDTAFKYLVTEWITYINYLVLAAD